MQIGSEKWLNVLKQRSAAFDVDLRPEALAAFTDYAQELLSWSRKVNLTAIKDPYEIAVKHFIDSLAPVPLIRADACMLDIGAGTGFPGLPIKILRPDLQVDLIDASRKKVSFMQHVIRLLALEKVAAHQIRAEERGIQSTFKRDVRADRIGRQHPPGRTDLRLPDRYDVVIARALSSLKEFVRLAMPVVAENGSILAMKGCLEDVEVEEARTYLKTHSAENNRDPEPWKVVVKHYQLPFINDRRSIVLICQN